MPEIIKHGVICDDQWQTVPKDSVDIPAGDHLLVHAALWFANSDTCSQRKSLGVWFDSDDLPSHEQASLLQSMPLIAVNFPVFTDGRGFSIARLLRERFGYKGELRAMGYVLRDQLCFLKRCGFDSFLLPEGSNLQEALQSLEDFTEYYQTSVDQPQPLFRRS